MGTEVSETLIETGFEAAEEIDSVLSSSRRVAIPPKFPSIADIITQHQTYFDDDVVKHALGIGAELKLPSNKDLRASASAIIFFAHIELGRVVDVVILARVFDLTIAEVNGTILKLAKKDGTLQMSAEGFLKKLCDELGFELQDRLSILDVWYRLEQIDDPILEENPVLLAAGIVLCKAPSIKPKELADYLLRSPSQVKEVAARIRTILTHGLRQ